MLPVMGGIHPLDASHADKGTRSACGGNHLDLFRCNQWIPAPDGWKDLGSRAGLDLAPIALNG